MTSKGVTINQVIRETGVAVLAGEKLTVIGGDTVRVRLSLEYRGPAIDGSAYVAIGRQNLGFAEDFSGSVPVHFDQSFDWQAYSIAVDVPIWDRPGSDYDIYAKIMGVPGPDIFTDVLLNVIDVIGAVEFQGFTIDSYEKV